MIAHFAYSTCVLSPQTLLDPGRSLIKSGRLVKLSGAGKEKGGGAGKRIEYHFFLFNDLIIYASEGMQSKYKVHRVLHLSLCRVVDVKTPSGERNFHSRVWSQPAQPSSVAGFQAALCSRS